MSDTDEYIEAYFKNKLNDSEKQQFEQRCVKDDSFAKEVAFYVALSEAAREKLLEQKKKYWTEGEQDNEKISATPVKKIGIRKWLLSAAACLLVVWALSFLYGRESPRQLAEKYVEDHYTQLSQTMDASQDSLQLGIAAYNEKNYAASLQIFNKVYSAHPENTIALKYIGLTYLTTKDYNNALLKFEELANKPGVYKRPGLFLKAITLLERNNGTDKQHAKLLLEQVVKEKSEGSSEAEKWLTRW